MSQKWTSANCGVYTLKDKLISVSGLRGALVGVCVYFLLFFFIFFIIDVPLLDCIYASEIDDECRAKALSGIAEAIATDELEVAASIARQIYADTGDLICTKDSTIAAITDETVVLVHLCADVVSTGDYNLVRLYEELLHKLISFYRLDSVCSEIYELDAEYRSACFGILQLAVDMHNNFCKFLVNMNIHIPQIEMPSSFTYPFCCTECTNDTNIITFVNEMDKVFSCCATLYESSITADKLKDIQCCINLLQHIIKIFSSSEMRAKRLSTSDKEAAYCRELLRFAFKLINLLRNKYNYISKKQK